MCENPSTKCAKSIIPPPLPPTQMKSGFFSFVVFFFLASRVRTPTYKIVISPEKLRAGGCGYSKILKTKGTFLRGAYHTLAGIRPAEGHKPREKKTSGFKIF